MIYTAALVYLVCLHVQDKRDKQDKLADSNLYIKNLDDSQTDDKLRQLFEVRQPSFYLDMLMASWNCTLVRIIYPRTAMSSRKCTIPSLLEICE